MIKQLLVPFIIISLLSSCTLSPDRPQIFVAPAGENWIFSYLSDPITGSVHLTINGDIIASGSHGMFFGNKARGKGSYKGHKIYFQSHGRGKPTIIIYVDGKEAMTLIYSNLKKDTQPKE